jgi:TatD DNase family protein
MVKKSFDTPLAPDLFPAVRTIVEEAKAAGVTTILNVGTSLQESINCIELARAFPAIYAAIGIHPNDLTDNWKDDLKELKALLLEKERLKVVAIGECGMDFHYPDHNVIRQQDAFKSQIELALENDLAVVVHTRDAGEETLRCLEEFKDPRLRGVIHCFSETMAFAHDAINMGFVLGIGGTITYPKNDLLRQIVMAVGLDHIILETDAPYLPPQVIRGKQNRPASIKIIAEYLSNLFDQQFESVSFTTTENAQELFRFTSR